jgi:hypothetical protein
MDIARRFIMTDMFSSSDKIRGTIRSGKARDGLLLVRQEHTSCTLIELMQISKTSSSPNRILHDAPEALDGIEIMARPGG